MDLEEELKALHDINEQAFAVLKDVESTHQRRITGRDAYFLGLYGAAIAQVQGIICLADQKQYRVADSLLRNLFEIYVTVRFIYATRTFLYGRLLVLNSERKRSQKLRQLSEAGHVAIDAHSEHAEKLKKMEVFIERNYPAWPDRIPGVFISGSPAERRRISLKDMCKVTDFYDQRYKRVSSNAVTLVQNYELIYEYLSGITHSDAISLGQVMHEDENSIFVNIDGSANPDAMARSCAAAFAYMYELVHRVRQRIYREKIPEFPEHIQNLTRKKGLID